MGAEQSSAGNDDMAAVKAARADASSVSPVVPASAADAAINAPAIATGADPKAPPTNSDASSGQRPQSTTLRGRTNTAVVETEELSNPGLDEAAMASLTAFQVLHKLGEGGFGKVVLVRKKQTGDIFALKSIDKRRIKPNALEYVLLESEALQKTHHPFVVRMLGAFQDAHHFFFLLEFVRGGDLYQMLKRVGTFPLSWCRVYMGEIALALSHIHELGYIYRDLKLENVLVGHDAHIKLADFGLATKADADDGHAVEAAGTLFCMAPEVLLEQAYDCAVDWWALGVLFCEISGQQLDWIYSKTIPRETRIKMFKKSRHLVKLSTLWSEEGLEAAAAEECYVKLLAVEPKQRVRSLADLQRLNLYRTHPPAWWAKLLALEIEAPLATELRDSQLVETTHAASPGVAYAAPGELAKVERNFKTFMTTPSPSTQRPPAAAGKSSSATASSIDTSSTALCDAAARSDTAALRTIVKAGGAIDLGDYDKRTALHLAASEGLLIVVQCLIEELNAFHSPTDRWDNTPLDDALRHRHQPVISYLEALGAQRKLEETAVPQTLRLSAGTVCDAAARGDVPELRNLLATYGAGSLAKGDCALRQSPLEPQPCAPRPPGRRAPSAARAPRSTRAAQHTTV